MATKVIVSGEEFSAAVKIAAKAAKGARGVFAGIRITAEKGLVTVTGGDGTTFAVASTGAVDVVGGFAALVDAKALGAAVASASSTFTIEQTDDGVCVRSESAAFDVSRVDGEYADVPRVAPMDKRVSVLDGEWLTRTMKSADAHSARETSRYSINGARLELQGKKLRVLATCGRRALIVKGAPLQAIGDVSATLHLGTVRMVSAVGMVGEVSAFAEKSGGQTLRVGFMGSVKRGVRVCVWGVPNDGAFPPIDDVVPKDFALTIDANAADLCRAFTNAGAACNEESRGVSVWRDGNTMRMVGTGAGKSFGQCDASFTAHREGFEWIGINPEYALAAIKACNTPSVRVQFIASNKPILVSGGDVLVVVMPVMADVDPRTVAVKLDAKTIRANATPDSRPVVSKASTPVPRSKPAKAVKAAKATNPTPKPQPASTPTPTGQGELSPHARALVDALAKIGGPAIKATMLQTAGIPASAWSDALSEAYRARKITRDRARTDNVWHVLAK